jgi:hypothetical protein
LPHFFNRLVRWDTSWSALLKYASRSHRKDPADGISPSNRINHGRRGNARQSAEAVLYALMNSSNPAAQAAPLSAALCAKNRCAIFPWRSTAKVKSAGRLRHCALATAEDRRDGLAPSALDFKVASDRVITGQGIVGGRIGWQIAKESGAVTKLGRSRKSGEARRGWWRGFWPAVLLGTQYGGPRLNPCSWGRSTRNNSTLITWRLK